MPTEPFTGYIEAYNDTIDNIVKLIDRLRTLALRSDELARHYEETGTKEDVAFHKGMAKAYRGARYYALDMYEASAKKERWIPPIQISRSLTKEECEAIEGAEWNDTHRYCAIRPVTEPVKFQSKV